MCSSDNAKLEGMAVEIITKDDLQILRGQIVSDIKALFEQNGQFKIEDLRGYRTKEVRELLLCSAGKLKSLRASGRIRTKRIGGTVYYNKEDVKKLLTTGF
jgi:hypothetical protein